MPLRLKSKNLPGHGRVCVWNHFRNSSIQRNQAKRTKGRKGPSLLGLIFIYLNRSSNSSSQSTSRRKKPKRKEVAQNDEDEETASVPDRPEDGTEINSGQRDDTRTETLPNQANGDKTPPGQREIDREPCVSNRAEGGKDDAPNQPSETDTENPPNPIQDRNQTFSSQSVKDVESIPPPNHPVEEALNESDSETVIIQDESSNSHHGLSDPELALLQRFHTEITAFHDICIAATRIDDYPIDNETEIKAFLKKATDSCRLEIKEIPPIPIIRGSICHQNSDGHPPPGDPRARFSAHRKAVRRPIDPLTLFLQRFHSILMGAYFKNISRRETTKERTQALWQLVKDCDNWTKKDFTLFLKECTFLWDIFEICGLPFLWFGNSLCHFVLTTSIFKMKTEFPSYLTTHLRNTMVGVTCLVFQGHSLSWLEELSFPQDPLFVSEPLTKDAGVTQSSINSLSSDN
jgi:hypothetical protein